MENQELVLLERQDGIAIVTLNRPSSLNALSISLRNKLAETFKEIASDGKTKVVILTGSGRAFTVGLDLKELGARLRPLEKLNQMSQRLCLVFKCLSSGLSTDTL